MLRLGRLLGEKLGIFDGPPAAPEEIEMQDLSHLRPPADPAPLASADGTTQRAAEPFRHLAEEADPAPAVQAPGDGAKAPEKALEEMITLYHMTTPDGMLWAENLAAEKGKGTPFDKLRHPIDPEITKRKRTPENPGGDDRGGDDLGPGFYTTSSADFVKYYAQKAGIGESKRQGGVLSFQIARKALEEGFDIEDIDADDDAKFKQYIKAGFGRIDETSRKWTDRPDLDVNPSGHDILRGPINDVDKQSWPVEGGKHYKEGEILKLPDGQVPEQVTFASQPAAENLYTKANIQYADLHDWLQAQQKKGGV
jgi:hypothetical protein